MRLVTMALGESHEFQLGHFETKYSQQYYLDAGKAKDSPNYPLLRAEFSSHPIVRLRQ